jgi:hypothetical protein
VKNEENLMTRTNVRLSVCLLLMCCCALPLMARRAASADTVVPAVVKFAGTLNDVDGKPLTGTQGVTFLLYKEETGGAPLWMETQNVQADKNGRYSVTLGSVTSNGLPAEAFSAGEARWLGVQPSGQAEKPRTLLVSVPYALKALDAETLGGRPASAFLMAPAPGSPTSKAGAQIPPAAEQANEVVCSSGTACKSGFVPLFASNGGSAKVTDSIVTQSGTTLKVAGSETVTSTASAPALVGRSSGTNAVSDGVDGVASSASASGVAGINKGNGIGVYGTGGTGVYGTGPNAGGTFVATTAAGTGVFGSSNPGNAGSFGGFFISNNGTGVVGSSSNGLAMDAEGGAGQALVAANNGTQDTFVATNTGSGFPLFVGGPTGGVFITGNGDLTATGSINGASKNFRIDHPLDPANKYLNHTSIESSEMLNLYTGNAVLDASGSATVSLPAWFTAVNQDFRYQLTPVGAFAPLYIAEQLTKDHFVIAGGQPGMKVSWQITGVRHDAYAKAHPLTVEERKGKQRGLYLHPELFGAPREKSFVATHLAGTRSARGSASASR